MTISSATRTAGPFSGTGAVVSYPFTFKVFTTADLAVVRTDTGLVQSTLALGTDYTVMLNSDQNIAPGGTVTPLIALPVGYTLTLTSNIAATQTASLTNAGGFFPKTIEDALDRLTILLQQLGFSGSQTLRVPEVTGAPAIPAAAARANGILAFDSSGNPIIVPGQSGTASSLAIDLANQTLASKGAGQVGFSYGLAYSAGTIGRWLQDLATSAGSTFVGFLQAGVGAVLRTSQTKLREVEISVDDFGAVGDGVADDSAAITAAQTALLLRGGGRLKFSYGKNYRLTAASIPMQPGITYVGTGRSAVDNAPNQRGARIVSVAVPLFKNAATLVAGVSFRDLWLESEPGGDHVFDWSLAGIVAKVECSGCTLIQGTAGKKIVNGTSAGGIFSIWFHDFEFRYLVGNTVPAFHIASTTVNSITIERYWALCTLGATSGTYAIWIESTNAGGAAFNVNVRQGVHEVPGGGAVQLLSCQQSCIEDVGIYDLAVTPNNAMFRIAKGATGPASNDCSVRRLRSTVGTALKPDLQIDLSVAGQSGFIVENCALFWYDGVSASGNGAVHTANSIGNYENAAYVEFGGSTGNDLRWFSQAAAGKTYAIWNGVPGNSNGYLNIFQNGTYFGAISPGGLFQWGGTVAAPAFYVGQSGMLNTKAAIYPGNTSLVDQGACGIYAGTGAPVAANGNNGDVYFNGAGAAGTTIYQKRAGAWVGIV